MPKKVLPSADALATFGRLMTARGFEEVTPAAFRTALAHTTLTPPAGRARRESRTLAFRYRKNGLSVWVWTTFMPALGRAAEHAAGWVLIVEKNSVRYFSHPVPRTKGFLRTLLWLAVIAQWRVDHRPACPLCGSPMGIAFGQEIKSRYWRCRSHSVHAGTVTLDWKHDLPEAAVEFERVHDEARAKRFAEDRAQGKEPGRALTRRKRWRKERAGEQATLLQRKEA